MSTLGEAGTLENQPENEERKNARPQHPNKVFVGGLSWETSGERLRSYFENFGAVREAFVSYNKQSGRPRGFGFVVFESAEVVDKVVLLKHTIDRREVEAKRAVPKEDSPEPKQPASSKAKKIFIGGLAPSIDEAQLRQHFGDYGTVEDAVVMYDHENKRSRGFGFVTFSDEAAVDKVFQAGPVQTLGDKSIEIKSAVPRDQMPSRLPHHHAPSPSMHYYSPRAGYAHHMHGPHPRAGGPFYGPHPGMPGPGYGPPPYGGYMSRGGYGGRGGYGMAPPHMHPPPHYPPGPFGPPPPRGRHMPHMGGSSGLRSQGGGGGGVASIGRSFNSANGPAQSPSSTQQQGVQPPNAHSKPASQALPQPAASMAATPAPASVPQPPPLPSQYEMYPGLPNGVNSAMLSIYSQLAGLPGGGIKSPNPPNLSMLNSQLKALDLTQGLGASAGFPFGAQAMHGGAYLQHDQGGYGAGGEEYRDSMQAALAVSAAEYGAYHEGGFVAGGSGGVPGWSS